MITDTEMEDFEGAITNAGFKVDDFDPVAVEDEVGPDPQPITGTVTVNRESTGNAITYQGGYGSTWVADFEADLNAGVFGTP